MIEFPAIWVLYGFYGLGGLLVLLALAYTLNGLRYGSKMTLTITATGLFLAGIVALLWISWTLLSPVDWTSTFSIDFPTFNFTRFGL